MGKSVFDWYPRAVRLIRLYPQLRSRKDSSCGSITQKYSAVPGGRSPSRTTENAALKQLAPIDDLSLDIVQAAINEALARPHGDLTLEIIRRVDWDKTHTLENISAVLPVSRMTAQRYRSGFIRLVAKKAGWI